MRCLIGVILVSSLACTTSCSNVPRQVLDNCNNPDPAEAPDRMVQACSRVMATSDGLDSANTARVLVNRGAAHLASYEIDAAVADFNAALQIDPDLGSALTNRGNAHAARHETDAAIADFNAALQIDPNLAPALASRGRARLLDHETSAAITDFNAALQIDPNFAPAYGLRAEAYFAKGDTKAAQSDENRALALRPNNYRSFQLRCWLHGIRSEQIDATLNDCNEALRLSPGNPAILDSLGLVQFRRRRFSDAIAAYNAALKAYPRLWTSLYMRGLSEEKLGDTAGASADIKSAEAIDPEVNEYFADFGSGP